MRGIELVILSVLLLSAQQLATGSPAPSQGMLDSVLSGLTNALEASSSVEVASQMKSALAAAGCSETAVEQFKVTSGKACINVFQATVSYQQFFLNVIYATDKTKIYLDKSCFTGQRSYIAELKCYLDNLEYSKQEPLFKTVKGLVDEINAVVKLYMDNYKRCIKEENYVKYSVGSEEFSSLESVVKAHCPAGTSLEALREF